LTSPKKVDSSVFSDPSNKNDPLHLFTFIPSGNLTLTKRIDPLLHLHLTLSHPLHSPYFLDSTYYSNPEPLGLLIVSYLA
jgi:hypothetical protein